MSQPLQRTNRTAGKPQQRSAWRSAAALAIVAGSLAHWVWPSDVVKLIVEQDHVLLGRYSKERFSLLFFLTPALWLAAFMIWRDVRLDHQGWFRLIAVTGAIGLSLVIGDVAGRALRSPRYIEGNVLADGTWPGERVEGDVRSRPFNVTYQVRYVDAPPAARSYPQAPRGFPPVDVTLRTDHRGFRNAGRRQQCDVLMLGDSFVEGSRVSDDECWPVLVEQAIGRDVYNLGISGGSPRTYLDHYLVHGRGLRPRVVVCMIYEGNDFRSESRADTGRGAGRSIERMAKSSPIVLGLRRTFIELLGPINADAAVAGGDALSWMPAAVGPVDQQQHYSFHPKRLTRLCWEPQAFKQSAGWRATARTLEQLHDACRRDGARLLITYAPSAPHVLLPLLGDGLSPQQLHAFVSVSSPKLPDPQAYHRWVLANLDTQEQTLAQFCEERGVPFVSPTAELRRRMAQGVQVYYTYDQHWTRLGHAAVAEAVGPHVVRMLDEQVEAEDEAGTSGG